MGLATPMGMIGGNAQGYGVSPTSSGLLGQGLNAALGVQGNPMMSLGTLANAAMTAAPFGLGAANTVAGMIATNVQNAQTVAALNAMNEGLNTAYAPLTVNPPLGLDAPTTSPMDAAITEGSPIGLSGLGDAGVAAGPAAGATGDAGIGEGGGVSSGAAPGTSGSDASGTGGMGEGGGTGGGSGGECFPGFVRVRMADGSSKPIAEMQIGDQVESLDWNTGQSCAGTVSEVHHYTRAFHDTVYWIDQIPVTGPHGVAVGWNQWAQAEDIEPDHRVLDGGRWRAIETKHEAPWNGAVYNLEVPGPANFIVTDLSRSMLVHNGGGKHSGGWVRPGAMPGPEEYLRLLEGEYVINPKAAQAFGPILEQMNRMVTPSNRGRSPGAAEILAALASRR